MYKLIKGNIQQLANQAILSMEGYVSPPTMHPAPSPHNPLQRTPTLESLSSSPYSFEQGRPDSTSPYPLRQLQASTPTSASVMGTTYPQDRTDSRSIQLSKHNGKGGWDQAKEYETQILLEWALNNFSKSWIDRRLDFIEKCKGRNHPEAQAALQVLGTYHMNAGNMFKAAEYFCRLFLTFQDKNSPKAREVMGNIRICNMVTMR